MDGKNLEKAESSVEQSGERSNGAGNAGVEQLTELAGKFNPEKAQEAQAQAKAEMQGAGEVDGLFARQRSRELMTQMSASRIQHEVEAELMRANPELSERYREAKESMDSVYRDVGRAEENQGLWQREVGKKVTAEAERRAKIALPIIREYSQAFWQMERKMRAEMRED